MSPGSGAKAAMLSSTADTSPETQATRSVQKTSWREMEALQIVWGDAPILQDQLGKLLFPFQCFRPILSSCHKLGGLARKDESHLIAAPGLTSACAGAQTGTVHENSVSITLHAADTWGEPAHRWRSSSTSDPWGWVKDGLSARSVRFFAFVSF